MGFWLKRFIFIAAVSMATSFSATPTYGFSLSCGQSLRNLIFYFRNGFKTEADIRRENLVTYSSRDYFGWWGHHSRFESLAQSGQQFIAEAQTHLLSAQQKQFPKLTSASKATKFQELIAATSKIKTGIELAQTKDSWNQKVDVLLNELNRELSPKEELRDAWFASDTQTMILIYGTPLNAKLLELVSEFDPLVDGRQSERYQIFHNSPDAAEVAHKLATLREDSARWKRLATSRGPGGRRGNPPSYRPLSRMSRNSYYNDYLGAEEQIRFLTAYQVVPRDQIEAMAHDLIQKVVTIRRKWRDVLVENRDKLAPPFFLIEQKEKERLVSEYSNLITRMQQHLESSPFGKKE